MFSFQSTNKGYSFFDDEFEFFYFVMIEKTLGYKSLMRGGNNISIYVYCLWEFHEIEGIKFQVRYCYWKQPSKASILLFQVCRAAFKSRVWNFYVL